MPSIRDVLRDKKENESQFAKDEPTIRGVLVGVDSDDTAEVSGQPGYVWVQLYGQAESTPIPVFRRKVPPTPNLRVLVRKLPKQKEYEILDWDASETITRQDGFTAPVIMEPHAKEHLVGGRDPLYIYLRALTMLRCSPTGQGFKVSVPPTNYPTGQGDLAKFAGHNSFDLASHQPSSGEAVLVLVYLDTATNALDSVAGNPAPDTPTIQPPAPAIPEDAIPSAYVRISGDATKLFERDIIEDTRAFINPLIHNAAKIRGYKVETGAPASGEHLAYNSISGEIEWTLPTFLAAPDGNPNPAWEVDNAGNLSNSGSGVLDLGGVADAIVLDADGDTSISAPTNNQIDLEVGGVDIARVTSTGISLPQTGDDFRADGDNFGLFQRLINYGFTPLEHWRNGADELTWTGWASYTGFATPSSIARTSSKLTVDNSASTRAFYYRSFINAQTQLTARLGPNITGATAEIGLMVDDGGNNVDGFGANNFLRVFIEATGTGLWTLNQEYRTGGGGVTKSPASAITLIPGSMYGIILLYGVGTRWSSWSGRFRILGEAGVELAMGGTPNFGWTPVRHGLFYRNINGSGRPAAWDWFHES